MEEEGKVEGDRGREEAGRWVVHLRARVVSKGLERVEGVIREEKGWAAKTLKTGLGSEEEGSEEEEGD
jgi:hypothetical protein